MKTKRTLSLVLSIMMIVSSLLLPANAFANDYVTGYDEVKNPLIQDACDENYVQAKTVFSSGAASYSSDVVYSNPIQAAEALRDGLVKRQNPIKVEFYYTKDFDDSSTTGVAIFSKLFNMAISEDISVSSVDGDYLRWSWGGYGVNHAYKDMGDGKIYGSLTYNISYYTTAEEESILTDKINADIGALNLDGKSEYLKVKAIHDYLCESIKYDYVNLNNKEYKYKFSGYGSLVLGYGVCQGYSALFTRICEENGLISRIIVGQNHAWNIVKVGDKFYNVDVTWDDTHYDTPSDPNGNYWSDNYYHKWMLKGSEDFDQHITVDEFSTKEFWASYPLAKTAYVCNHENSHIVIPDTADCTKGFQTHQYCENCGLDFDQKIIPANSTHIITTSVVAPTCTEQGYTNQKCSRCKYENKVDYVEAKNHTIVVQDAVEPTCTQTGLTQGSYCSICNEVFAVQEEIPAKGHTVVIDEGVAPTCTTPGNIIKSHCSVCNIEFGETGYIPALGHKYDSVVTLPTCTEQGYTTHTCSRCGVFYVDNYTDELGHAVVKDEAVAPTCENTGLTEGSHCSVCHIEITKQSVIPALGHSYQNKVFEPTCTERGYIEYTCVRCNDSYTDNFTDARGHTFVVDNAVLPTCTTTGLTEGSHCSACGEIFVAQDIVPAYGHTVVVDNEKSPTCTESGLTEGSHCSVCGEILVAQETIPAKGHNYDSVVTLPTCTERGYIKYTCVRCNDSYVDNYIQAIGHKYSSSVKAPTCTEQGYTTYICIRCNDSYTDNFTDAKGHTFVVDNAVLPTCTTTGLTEGSHCSACGEIFVAQNIVPAYGHTVVVDNEKSPTCTESGLTQGSHCSVCGEILVAQETIPAKGHDVQIDDGTEPSCTEPGIIKASHCAVCNTVFTEQDTIPPLGHNYDSVVTLPTCTEQGYTTHTCSRCGASYVDNYIQAIGHEYVSSVKAPTCTEQGYTTYTCIRCNNKYNVDYVKPKTHSNVAKVTKATISKDGKIEYTCTVCKRKYSTSIPKASNIKLSATSYTYDGKVKTPSVTVKDSKGKTLRKNTDYTISYASGRKNVGKYAVKITFKGNYSGSKTLYFTINPKGTSISKITAAKKGFKVYWKKQSTQTTGYQIQYSTSSKFSKAKTVTLTKNSYTSKSISKLSAKKKYYVRIRTYKKIGSTYYYSSWSKAKYVTTKK